MVESGMVGWLEYGRVRFDQVWHGGVWCYTVRQDMDFIVKKGFDMENTETKFYPAWKQAGIEIAEMVKNKGYGFIISHDDLLNMLELKKPTGLVTPAVCEQFSLKRLSYIELLKDFLLRDNNIYLWNVQGEGYQVLCPDEQVKAGPAKHLKHARKEISKAIQILTNVNNQLLSTDGKRIQERGIARVAFLESCFSQKKIPTIPDQKMITDN